MHGTDTNKAETLKTKQAMEPLLQEVRQTLKSERGQVDCLRDSQFRVS